jgi:hypothetical protein
MAAIYNKGTMYDIEQILKFDGNPEVLAMMIEWQTVK